ncbi:hypothetical protein CUREO4125_08035 [Campylobacter ureolyticus]|uniref:hypothetical protein n=1 Tax=Campylobacter ureolyticus TaxID=827 RepID=UPI00215A549A|nr:hypothetical protein [Campylobacter ureolyticus]MCR8700326.1 hypothetical protein [Campylobacter ureolyticus]
MNEFYKDLKKWAKTREGKITIITINVFLWIFIIFQIVTGYQEYKAYKETNKMIMDSSKFMMDTINEATKAIEKGF